MAGVLCPCDIQQQASCWYCPLPYINHHHLASNLRLGAGQDLSQSEGPLVPTVEVAECAGIPRDSLGHRRPVFMECEGTAPSRRADHCNGREIFPPRTPHGSSAKPQVHHGSVEILPINVTANLFVE